jgi:hypothetical protein
VRLSLARTGRWITDQGVISPGMLRGAADELPAEELARITMETESALGRIRHLRPVALLSETPGHWTLPPAPLGHHPAAWGNGNEAK